MGEPTREPMNAVDAAWLRMDTPTNPMVITTVLVFDEPFSLAEVRAWVYERLLPHPRFRQRPVASRLPLGAPSWEDDPLFDLDSHLHRTALPAPGGEAELQALVGDLMSTSLDRARPLWQAFLVEGYRGGSAIVARVHHAVGDGVSLVELLLGMSLEGPAAAPPRVGLDAEGSASPLDLAKHAAGQAATLGRLLMLPADPHTPLRGELGVRKGVAWSRPVSVDDVKAIGRAHGAKLNDVLVACCTAALRDYLDARGALPPEGEELRALVPIFLRFRSESGELGNHFGLVFVPLPIGLADPVERLRECKRRLDAIKASDEARVALALLGAMGVASAELEHIGVEVFSRKASLLITNVPGPRERITLAGKPLAGLLVWAPVSGRIGVGLSLLSYGGSVTLGVSADKLRVPDPSAIVAAFEDELARLLDRPARRATR